MTINRNLSILASGVSSTGVLGVPNGGSGAMTLTGYLIGNGTGAFTASATIPTTALSGTVTNAQLANSTISGVSLGSSLFNLTAGTNISFSTGTTYNGSAAITINATASGGTVTSVAASVPAFLSITGSPITTSGTLAITLSGTALPVANGGTGLTTLTAGYIPYGNGTGAFNSSSNFSYDGTNLLIGTASAVGLITAQQASNTAPGIYSNSTGASFTGTVIYAAASRNTTNGSFNAFTYYNTGAGAFKFYVADSGAIYSTSIVITSISDERLKENIKDIETGLDSIMALKPRRFDWKNGKGQDKKNVAGFIAQEFEKVFPECVGTNKAGEDGIEYKNINHETLIPTLVKAIQQLKLDFDAYVASHP
jgi:hypothetical protein